MLLSFFLANNDERSTCNPGSVSHGHAGTVGIAARLGNSAVVVVTRLGGVHVLGRVVALNKVGYREAAKKNSWWPNH